MRNYRELLYKYALFKKYLFKGEIVEDKGLYYLREKSLTTPLKTLKLSKLEVRTTLFSLSN